MKKIATSVFAAGIAASSLMAADAAITAVKVSGDLSKVSYADAVWSKAKFSDVSLYPQTTIKLNDKNANEINAADKAITAKIAAVYNSDNIAFLIKWPDATMNIQHGVKTTSYGDGFAVQFAEDSSNPEALPYIGMGSEGREVVIHLQKAVRPFYEPNGNGDIAMQVNRNQTDLFGKDLAKFDKEVAALGNYDYERSFVSQGFRSMTEIKDGSNDSFSRLGYNKGDKGWEGTLSRSIADGYVDLNQGAIPVAFAVWDGEKLGRDGLKNLSQWVSVKLEGNEGGDALIAALDASAVKGDAAAGKQAVADNGCAGCHQIEKSDQESFMAPALYNIGGYATVGYLKESIIAPSAVVVPGYNRNAHSAYMWYTEENGKRTSTMTDYSFLDAATIDNMVAYLKTLKAEAK
jgi:complex iron-sulfur molybdoenzyme family reductase subunit gamma